MDKHIGQLTNLRIKVSLRINKNFKKLRAGALSLKSKYSVSTARLVNLKSDKYSYSASVSVRI